MYIMDFWFGWPNPAVVIVVIDCEDGEDHNDDHDNHDDNNNDDNHDDNILTARRIFSLASITPFLRGKANRNPSLCLHALRDTWQTTTTVCGINDSSPNTQL
jgi:hypothetical protein